MYNRHPFHWDSWYHHRGGHRPSRLLWFLLGAGTATFIVFRKEAHRNGDAYWGHCMKVPVQAPPQMQARERTMEPFQIPVPQHVQPRIPPSTDSPHPFQWGFEQQRAQWEQDLMNKAHETMTETLETLSETIGTLRAKLTEHRAQREKQLEQELEEKKRNPPRWV